MNERTEYATYFDTTFESYQQREECICVGISGRFTEILDTFSECVLRIFRLLLQFPQFILRIGEKIYSIIE